MKTITIFEDFDIKAGNKYKNNLYEILVITSYDRYEKQDYFLLVDIKNNRLLDVNSNFSQVIADFLNKGEYSIVREIK